jgi:hypothetical protein
MSGGPEWFAPKRFGIGAGLPIAWQGWATLGTYLAALLACVWRWGGHGEVTIAIMLPLTMLLLLVTWRTTRGGWHWRWGEVD